MTSFASLSLVNYGSLQLVTAGTGGIQEVGNVFQVQAAGVISAIQYRSGGQAADPTSLVFNIYRGTTLIHTVTGTSMAGANNTHTVAVTPTITTTTGEVYTVTVRIPTGGVLYAITGYGLPFNDQAGLLYIQGRDQTVFQYGYPNAVSTRVFDVNVIHTTDAAGVGGIISSQPFSDLATSITALNASITGLNTCCDAVLAAVRKNFT